jgi:AraC family ethanolamine operon transcriptional activator
MFFKGSMTQEGLDSGASTFPSGLRLSIRASSIEEMQEKAAFWRVRATQLEPGGYSGSIRAIHTALMQLGLSVCSNSTKVEGFVPERTLVLALPISVESSIQNRGRRLAENAIIAYDYTEGLEFSCKGPFKLITVAVSVREIERRARNLWGEAFEDRTSLGALWLPDASARMSAARKINAILSETMRDPFAVVSPRGCREVENAVLDTLLSSVLDRSRPERTPVRQKIARKAEEYLRTCCGEPISISDLCAAVGATRRTLHLGFVELYGVPPMHYLRAIRLRGAREDLTNARGCDLRVRDVATKWGFEHLGRFALAYRDFFGELPSGDVGLRARHATPH